jgi:DNA polymerase
MLAREDRVSALHAIAQEVANCSLCPLSSQRIQTVPGEGDPEARLMFIGEGPGYNEDQQGRPFVGQAGQLLDKMIVAMGLRRGEVFITNAVKCRPPNNRNPFGQEVEACQPYLKRQIDIVQPEVICLLGKVAANLVLNDERPLYKMREFWHEYDGIPVLVTYHPAYLLRNPNDKAKSWADLQKVMARLGLEDPRKKK